MTYHDIFSSWDDVKREFETDFPEPACVLFAAYEYEDYSGEALVVFDNGDGLKMVNGGHCSCRGLEGQWDIEDADAKQLRAEVSLDRDYRYGLKARYRHEILSALDEYERKHGEPNNE